MSTAQLTYPKKESRLRAPRHNFSQQTARTTLLLSSRPSPPRRYALLHAKHGPRSKHIPQGQLPLSRLHPLSGCSSTLASVFTAAREACT